MPFRYAVRADKLQAKRVVMKLFILMVFTFLSLTLSTQGFASGETTPQLQETTAFEFSAASPDFDFLKTGTEFSNQCCKICKTGKACGDSCISITKNCTKGVGCACDG